LLVGLWKAGKTTLVSHLFATMYDGGQLAGEVTRCRVLVVSEEGSALWAQRRDKLGISDHVHIITRPFRARLSRVEWADFIEHLAAIVEAEKFDLVVLDPLASLWPVRDENDAADVLSALAPLSALTAAGAGVLLIHHPRKGDASEAQASRGSGALTAHVDAIVELRRFAAQQNGDRRRVLRCYSRFDSMPDDVVIELGENGYRAVGTNADAKREDRIPIIRSILASNSDGMTVEAVREAWPEDDTAPRPGKTKLRDELELGVAEQRWSREGDGVRSNPHRYVPRFDSSAPTPTSVDETNQPAAQV
jgi:hypothetical protein